MARHPSAIAREQRAMRKVRRTLDVIGTTGGKVTTEKIEAQDAREYLTDDEFVRARPDPPGGCHIQLVARSGKATLLARNLTYSEAIRIASKVRGRAIVYTASGKRVFDNQREAL